MGLSSINFNVISMLTRFRDVTIPLTSMKKKIVRLAKLNRLRVTPINPNQGAGPCALELSAVLNCWSNSRDGGPDAAECRALVNTLASCMRSYVRNSLPSAYASCEKADLAIA